MKKLLLGIAIAAALTACNQKEKAQIAQLQTEKAQMAKDAASKDSVINQFFESLNQIESSLGEIKMKESTISKETAKGGELSKDSRARINDDIKVINDLMNKNKRSISWLKKQLKESNIKIEELQKMIEKTNLLLVEKDSTISQLKDNLTKLNFSIQSLNDTLTTVKQENAKLAGVVATKTNEMNQAYFIMGTEKELVAKGIVVKEGGFLGLGKSIKLASAPSDNSFTPVDMRTLNSIPLTARKITLVTPHPADSYEIVGTQNKVTELVIKDSKAFWQKSKYLVIAIEK